MKLSGKAKEKFEEWYCVNVFASYVYKSYYNLTTEDYFYNQHPSMQYGVYVDFFDSVGIRLSIRNIGCNYWYIINYPNKENKPDRYEGRYSERPETRTKAIEKANELLNERL